MSNATSSDVAGRPAQIGASASSVNATRDPNKPPQVYQGPPPTHGGYDDAPPKSNAAPFYAGGIFVAVLALFFVMRMLAPAPVQAIDALEAHTSKDKVFACQAPSGWEVEMGARSDGLSGSSLWTSGSAKILISDDLGGSLMSEGAPPVGKTKVQALHERALRSMEQKYGSYEEQAVMRIADNGFGETWKSEFTAQGSFREGKLRGMRATMLSLDKRVKFIATCRAQDWDKLKPGFEKVLQSLGRPAESASAVLSAQ